MHRKLINHINLNGQKNNFFDNLSTKIIYQFYYFTEENMLEDFKMPIQELKQDILNVWGRL